ncbi:MAG: ribonuclease HII [Acidihalobacter sp.]|uniref:ribonuclease HII n=1 Tax=Acidihalobacter sp. TaxID=1872108 RepID=UPI00307D3ECD
MRLVAGVDEAGRGPLAGPVVAAAVVLDPARPIAGLADSKKLSARRREILAVTIRKDALAWAVAGASVEEIDELNILHASMLAMRRALEALTPQAEHALIDGNRCPTNLLCTAEAIVGGDARVEAISAASILAKVTRDEEMLRLHEAYPDYEFARHKGYPTALHLDALGKFGPSDCHRLSFAPVRRAQALFLKDR